MIFKVSDIADQARFISERWPHFESRLFRICFWALILIGIAARLFPFIDIDDRLYWQYITEDGYLFQTIARNMAIGNGMSTADGTISTNGFQPLAAILFSVLYYIAGGSKPVGIALVTLFSIFVSVVCGYYAFKVASRIFFCQKHGRELAIISAALWFAAPHTITNSMNGLETGVYYAFILFTLNYYLSNISDKTHIFTLWQRLLLGLLLGLTFLARNDAVFFIGGLLLAHVLSGDDTAGGGYRYRLVDSIIAGITSLVVALPWLANNYARFGSIVPISGISESSGTHFGQNMSGIPATLFGSTFIYAPIPSSIQHTLPVILMSLMIVPLTLIAYWYYSARLTLVSRRFFLASLLFSFGISVYYGFFFGAPHFLGRYVSPLSPFLWFAMCSSMFFILNFIFRSFEGFQRAGTLIVLILTIGAATFAYTDFARGYSKGTSQMHEQVVKWVQNNVEETQWLGAPQTGTLGFFHDRTINLDGKVNPVALRAIIEKGDVLEYVRNSKIDYLADWYGITSWVKLQSDPQFAMEFEVVVSDKPLNLGVLRRIHPIEQ